MESVHTVLFIVSTLLYVSKSLIRNKLKVPYGLSDH